ncbi:MAG: hypothetical protein HOP20_07785 [Sulfuriferula sp.]|nr:hypothetical protein [Sulfuriferula sp.]
MSIVMATFKTIDMLFASCEMDLVDMRAKTIDESFFAHYENQRIINSFLFNFGKIQDKIGAKLFRAVLYAQQEIEDESMPMRDVLNVLEKLKLLNSADDWERLREIRNALAHEYPFDITERIENIHLAMDAYSTLKTIYANLQRFMAGAV